MCIFGSPGGNLALGIWYNRKNGAYQTPGTITCRRHRQNPKPNRPPSKQMGSYWHRHRSAPVPNPHRWIRPTNYQEPKICAENNTGSSVHRSIPLPHQTKLHLGRPHHTPPDEPPSPSTHSTHRPFKTIHESEETGYTKFKPPVKVLGG